MKKQLVALVVVLLSVASWILTRSSDRIDLDPAFGPESPIFEVRNPSESGVSELINSSADVGADLGVEDVHQPVPMGERDTINDAWASSRGYDMVEPHWYKVDDKYAELQAVGGDLGAQKYLAWRTFGDTAATMHWLRESALGGSTAALMGMAERSNIIAEERLGFKNHRPGELDKADFRILSLAYSLSAQLRGDHYTAPLMAARYAENLSLSQEEIRQACARATELYEELAAERIARGLGEFDNSPPPGGAHPPNYDQFCLS